jgi:hypothetical protein
MELAVVCVALAVFAAAGLASFWCFLVGCHPRRHRCWRRSF